MRKGKAVKIENGKVVNKIIIDLDNPIPGWIVLKESEAETVNIGWSYDGTQFQAPPTPETPEEPLPPGSNLDYIVMALNQMVSDADDKYKAEGLELVPGMVYDPLAFILLLEILKQIVPHRKEEDEETDGQE